MINPRSSQDPEIRAALRAWDSASPNRDTAFDDAMRMCTALRHTASHQAFGWAALTCGRIAAHRQKLELAEEMLTEALGRLFLVGDKYGEALAIAHLAIPHVLRQNLHCQREDHEAAGRDADALFEYLKAGNHATTWLMFACNADAFSLCGQTEKAQYCLDRANVLLEPTRTPHANAAKLLSDARLLQARKNHDAAIAIAKVILDHPAESVMIASHREAASVLSRSYAALGRKSDAAKWKQVANELGRENLLGDILTRQFRTSIAEVQPLEPLTEKELTCLSLSAHGQTSADIALKLGIKTRTVNFHFAKILRKLNALNRQEAIAKASEANLLRRPR
ncbi:MAG: helix-turn-helix transcriptional regulator [Betaproteobacteria bacterium]|nr:helix-turn-helix transcriptional regulator [Betaproteobacteria bacterium]